MPAGGQLNINREYFDLAENPEKVVLVNAALRNAFAEQERQLRDAYDRTYKLAYDQAYGAVDEGQFQNATVKRLQRSVVPSIGHPNGRAERLRVIEIVEEVL